MGLTNPTTNSYRRLVPGFEAPVSAIFSLANRSAAIRIPKYADRPESVRMEFRPPDAMGNPYLSLAAQLLAGLDGIRQRLDPVGPGVRPGGRRHLRLARRSAAPPSRPCPRRLARRSRRSSGTAGS
jgi:glutamine synthetase